MGNPPVPGWHGGFQPCGDECGAARFRDARALRGLTMEQARAWLRTDRRSAAFKLGKPRYDFEKDETVLVLSDGRDSIRLVAVFNDAGQITHSWPEEYMTLMVRDLEKN